MDPAPFNIDIGTSENLVVNGAEGNDKIKGSNGLAALIDSTFNGDDGNDTIKGTDGRGQADGRQGRRRDPLLRQRPATGSSAARASTSVWSTGVTRSVPARSCWAAPCA